MQRWPVLMWCLVGACYAAHERAETDAAIDAPSSCGAQDASRTDAWSTCRSASAFFWDGRTCGWIGACACRGADCASGYEDFDACIDAHAGCAATRSCAAPSDCAADEYCQRSDCARSGLCRPRPADPLGCGFADERTCGCSVAGGFGNRCRAHLAGDDGAGC